MNRLPALAAALLLCAGVFHQAVAQVPTGPPGGRPAGGAPAGRHGISPPGKVSGVVVDAERGTPIPAATIALWRAADSTLATGAMADDEGAFRVEGLLPGRYYAQISFVGYETRTVQAVNLAPGAFEHDLGALSLAPSTVLMEDVQVTGERAFVETQIDRTVYNTRDQVISSGGNATDVLKNIPSLEVDVEGNVSLRGNANVAILINGRPAPMTGAALTAFLQGLPADQVDKVEVIPNPSARYEPDGMAGMLNLVLREDRDAGLSGSVVVGASTDPGYNGSASVNYGRGRMNVNAGYSFRRNLWQGEGWRERTNLFAQPLTYLLQQSADERTMPAHNVNASLEYRLSKLNSVTLQALASRRTSEVAGLNSYTNRDADRQVTSLVERRAEQTGRGLNGDVRLGFRRVREAGRHELTVELRQNVGDDDETALYVQEVFAAEGGDGTVVQRQRHTQDQFNRQTSAQLDYVRPLGATRRLEAGFKSELQKMGSDFFSESAAGASDPLTPDVHLVNAYTYDLHTHAAYGTFGADVGRFGFQAGVRLEQAFTTFDLETTRESFENDYFSLFPSAFVNYELTETRAVKVGYSKRINRPRAGGWFNQLNPFTTQQDPLFLFKGNPYLKPEYVHAVELSATQFTERTSLTLTPYFRRTVDVIRMINEVDVATGVSTTTFRNLDVSDSYGAEVIGTLRLGRRLNGFVNLNVFRVVTDGSNVDADLASDALGFSVRTNASVNVRPGLDVQGSLFYRAPMEVERGRIDAQTYADVALRQQLLKNRASLSLRMSDVFGTRGFHSWFADETVSQEFRRTFQGQQLGLTFTYNFGQAKPDARRSQPRPDENAGPPVQQGF